MHHAPAGGHAAGRDDDPRERRPFSACDSSTVLTICARRTCARTASSSAGVRRHAAVQPRHVDGHRAVEVDRQVGDALLRLEPLRSGAAALRPADRECRHQRRCRRAPRCGRSRRASSVSGVYRAVQRGRRRSTRPPPSRRLAARAGGGITGSSRRPRSPENSTDRPRRLEAHARRAEDVAGAAKAPAQARHRLELVVEFAHARRRSSARSASASSYSGSAGLCAREAVAVGVVGLLFHAGAPNPAAAAAHSSRVAPVAVHPAAKAQLHQPRQEAAVVDVRMRQHHRIDRARRHGQRRPVAQAQLLDALEQAAVDEQPPPLMFDAGTSSL